MIAAFAEDKDIDIWIDLVRVVEDDRAISKWYGNYSNNLSGK